MNTNHIKLYTPLSPAECAKKLRDSIDEERFPLLSMAIFWGSRPALGIVSDTSFRIRKKIWYGNAFQRFLNATLQPEGTGTLILGTFAMHTFVRIFMFIWFGGLILMGGTMFLVTAYSLATSSPHGNDDLMMVAVPAGMAVFGYVLVNFSAAGEKRFLTEFVKQRLDALERKDAA